MPANKIVYIAFTAFFLLGAYNMTQTTIEILKSSKRLDTLKGEVQGLQTQKQDLEKSIAYKNSEEYVEERARNALNLVKPGEKVFVTSSYTDQKPKQEPQKETVITSEKNNTNLLEWINFLF